MKKISPLTLSLLCIFLMSFLILVPAVLTTEAQTTTSNPAETTANGNDDPEPFFNLAVCYEGALGEQSTAGRFGYIGRNLDGETVNRNTVTNGGQQPAGITVGENTERIWSTNTYALNSNNHVWTVRIGSRSKTSTLDKLGGRNSIVTEQNQCPSENEPGTDIPEVSYPILLTLIGGGIIGGLFLGFMYANKSPQNVTEKN